MRPTLLRDSRAEQKWGLKNTRIKISGMKKEDGTSAVIAAAPLFLPHSIIKWSTSTLSVARLTIPDGKLQLRVIPFYTRRNLLVGVQNVYTLALSAHVEAGYIWLIPASTFNDKSSRIATAKTRYSPKRWKQILRFANWISSKEYLSGEFYSQNKRKYPDVYFLNIILTVHFQRIVAYVLHFWGKETRRYATFLLLVIKFVHGEEF